MANSPAFRANIIRKAAVATAMVLALVGCSDKESANAEKVTPEDAPVELSARQLQDEATVQIRTVNKEIEGKGGYDPSMTQRDLDYNSSNPSCTATHLNVADKGWFLFAGHCISELHAGAQIYDDTYDAIDEYPRYLDIWSGDQPASMKKIGRADSLIIDGDYTEGDWALLHVPKGRKLPGVKLSNVSPVDYQEEGREFYIAGYPQGDNFVKIQDEIKYSGLTSGQYFNDAYGLD